MKCIQFAAPFGATESFRKVLPEMSTYWIKWFNSWFN